MTMDVVSAELKTVLRRLKLSGMLSTLPDRLALARQQKMPHHDFMLVTLNDEASRRDSLGASLRAAKARLDGSFEALVVILEGVITITAAHLYGVGNPETQPAGQHSSAVQQREIQGEWVLRQLKPEARSMSAPSTAWCWLRRLAATFGVAIWTWLWILPLTGFHHMYRLGLLGWAILDFEGEERPELRWSGTILCVSLVLWGTGLALAWALFARRRR